MEYKMFAIHMFNNQRRISKDNEERRSLNTISFTLTTNLDVEDTSHGTWNAEEEEE
jgi:hypothetical protein